MSSLYDLHDELMIFVPIDPRTLDPVENESAFLELFAGSLASMVLGGMGFEALAHVIDMQEALGDIQDAVRPVVTANAVVRAINFYRRYPVPFSPGEVPGVWVPVSVPQRQMDATMARLFPALGVDWRTPNSVAQATARDVPYRTVDRSRRPALRPRW